MPTRSNGTFVICSLFYIIVSRPLPAALASLSRLPHVRALFAAKGSVRGGCSVTGQEPDRVGRASAKTRGAGFAMSLLRNLNSL